jgi:hypothetical protein
MIAKGYTADIAYSPEVAKSLDAWVWVTRQMVPVWFTNQAGERMCIGDAIPIRWWRQTTRKDGGINCEYAMVHFSVKHGLHPEKRMGDFCGSFHGISMNVSGFKVESIDIVKVHDPRP